MKKNLIIAGIALGFGILLLTHSVQAGSCTPVIQNDMWYLGEVNQSTVLNESLDNPVDCSQWARENGFEYWNQSLQYRAGEFDPYRTTCVGLVGTPSGTVPKPKQTAPQDFAGNTGSYMEYRSGRVCAVPTQVTASLIANPPSIQSGESSVLTWSSVGATSCVGTNFSTDGAVSGSLIVSPTATTQYKVACTGVVGSATAQTTVTVGSDFSVSCRAHPPTASTGEFVLWSSTVTAPSGGTLSYSWSGTDGLTGTQNQVYKQYTATGRKTASLTVTHTPSGSSDKSSGQCPAGQVARQTLTQMRGEAHCVGGKTIIRDSDTSDGVSYGGNLQDLLYVMLDNPDEPIPDGTCLMLSFRSGNSIGGGYPPNSNYSIRGYEGGTVAEGTAGMFTGGKSCIFGYNYTCGSMAGIVATECVPDGSGEGKEGRRSVTVQCDSGTDVLEGGGGSGSQCSDGVDNDNDGDVDLRDRGCTDSSDGSESSTGAGVTPQCSDGIDNNRDGTTDFPDDPWCTSQTDALELVEPAALTLSINPPLIKKNQQCTITLSAANVTSCTLTGKNVSKVFTATNGFVTESAVVTPALSVTTTYTLSCNGVDGKTATKNVDCKIAPTFQEI